MTRNQPTCVDNSEYLAYVRQNYLTRLAENLPKTVMEKDSWLTAPPILQEVSEAVFYFQNTRLIRFHLIQQLTYMFFQASQLLRKLHIRLMVRKYIRGITPQRKAQVVISATNAIHSTTLEWWTNQLQEMTFDLISLFLASVKSTNQCHVQRKEGKLPLQCVQTICRH